MLLILESGWVVQGLRVGDYVLGGCSLLPFVARKLRCCSIFLVGADKT